MLLNARLNSFILLFHPEFFSQEIRDRYKETYVSRLNLPYDTVHDYVSSTIQEIQFPDWAMDPVTQTRMLGKKQEMKNAIPVEDLFKREFTLKFQMADGFLNYFIMLENALDWLKFDTDRKMYLPVFKLGLMNNEGLLLFYIDFHMVSMTAMSNVSLATSAVNQEFHNFTATFKYADWRMRFDFGSKQDPY